MARILVVDDARFVRIWCAGALTPKGHEVLEAADGAEGVRAYQAHRPDMVLLDVLMPVMDGLAALREIRRIDPEARVAMLTTQGQQDVDDDARRAGARGFVVKPCPVEELLQTVERVLA